MKKSPGNSTRGKPPSIRTPSYLSTKPRTHLNVDRPIFLHQTLHPGSERLLSMSEGPEIVEKVDGIPGIQFPSKEISDCLSNWLSFLKIMKALCSTGLELTDSISVLSNSTSCKSRADHCKAMWEHLISATNTAAAIVRNQTIASLQEPHSELDAEVDQLEATQQVVCSGLLRLCNLQYQFSSACCEWLRAIGGCDCMPTHSERECEAIARCFTPGRGGCNIGVQAQPLQRRWSEAAAPGDGKPVDSTLRRWSIPWKLALPTSNNSERSRSTTPDSVWHNALASQEELQDVISLLSCRPANPNTHHLPGVVLTKAAEGQNSENMSRNLVHRVSWWGEGDELDVATLTSRKSSSSTDSSSCYSLHSRSTSGSEELTHGQRSHLYSMWSGSDLPFIKLPESTENNTT